jgi:protoheme ferro-lyase
MEYPKYRLHCLIQKSNHLGNVMVYFQIYYKIWSQWDSKFGHNKWLRDDTNENCDQCLALDSVFKY